MITVSEHLDRILATVPVLEVEAVPVAEASNRVLAGPVTAAIPVPPWTNSAMDGYAVRFEDLTGASKDSPMTLRVLGDLPAGSGEDPPLGPGETVRIMTGAPMPSSADTVIPQELTDGGTELVRIHDALSRGRHVREAGEDRGEGELVCPAGFELTPESLAGIVSAGVGEVVASRRPRIAVISTGDELVAPGQPLSRGQIPDSNGLLVSMLAGEAGAEVEVDHAGDGAGELPAVLERHRGVDVLILTGGVSVGAFDPVKALFESGDSVRFDRVAMQPGKPQAFGRLGDEGPFVFGLPGNPVSAWVSFQMFVRPALRKMQGAARVIPEPVPAQAAEDWSTPEGRMQVIPVRIAEGGVRRVLPAAAGGSGSHLAASLATADGYALVDAETEMVRVGDMVSTVRLRDPEQFNHPPRRES
ncbi:MAG: molybdopterin molybdotransferase MoeA [Solirubrobacterales bacterium]|nr:molybdopterin molybdotransferase MoeA [Solirubrobacterales bacterium]MCB8916064.1 molybdopterin molybdotransferase MoeA [Thermoleophilales bacterium]